MMESPMDIVGEGIQNCDDIQANIATMIEQGIAKFLKGKRLATGDVSNTMNMTHLHCFEGTLLNHSFSSNAVINSATWIIDTGASNHMCTNLALLQNFFIPSKHTPVYLPDGTVKSVENIGDVPLTSQDLESFRVLAVGKVIAGLYILDSASFDPELLHSFTDFSHLSHNTLPTCNVATHAFSWHHRLGHPSVVVTNN
ncbi:hypothetical protein Scep_002011 [Stephania cephalantha]|uniref:Retrovirus-related Pol polyprotein from transposon TNT 1-94-like beta-barrel domain-containing protein n=1 Tax=Stephania cephalantha TaxID=152367 RepID=A0AAP0LA81_9MAGN